MCEPSHNVQPIANKLAMVITVASRPTLNVKAIAISMLERLIIVAKHENRSY